MGKKGRQRKKKKKKKEKEKEKERGRRIRIIPTVKLVISMKIFFECLSRDQRPSDDTLAAVLSILHEVIKKTSPFAVSLYEVGITGRQSL